MVKAPPGSRQAKFQKREIRLHSAVSSHVSVVTLHKVVEEGSYIFLVLDFCAGGDMFKFLTGRGTYVRKDALVKDVMCQLIDGLAHCHQCGVFHRDIKPENIMSNQDGTRLQLGDFGLATDTAFSRNFGAGTSGYMSPGMRSSSCFSDSINILRLECIGAEMGETGYDVAANDVWALGIIFTSMISGHNPWRRAVMSDDCFRSYVRNPDFFKLMLPISAAADDILRSVFAPSEVRLSLSGLRAKIVAANTFFLTDDQIAGASRFVQLAAASYLCDITTHESSQSSSGPLLEIEHAEAAPRIAVEPESMPQPQPVELEVGIGAQPAQEELQADGIRAGMRKRPVPPPQRMPSFKDLMSPSPSRESSHSGGRLKKKLWGRSQSPTGLFRRIMDKIFVD